ncbi:hypothetical protein D3C77_288150 [compost metagenome]
MRGRGQAGDLPAYALERQVRAGLETLDLGSGGEHHQRRAGEEFLAFPGLPKTIDLAQLQHLMMRQQGNVRVLQLRLA